MGMGMGFLSTLYIPFVNKLLLSEQETEITIYTCLILAVLILSGLWPRKIQSDRNTTLFPTGLRFHPHCCCVNSGAGDN